MSADHGCPNCGAPVATLLTLCFGCGEGGWTDGPHYLSGEELRLYLDLRRGERRKMPQRWWRDQEGLRRDAALLRWHVQHELGAATREEILALAWRRTLEQARLFSWFSNPERVLSVWEAFQLAFPELTLRPWELPGQVPRHYWQAGGVWCGRRHCAGGWSRRD